MAEPKEFLEGLHALKISAVAVKKVASDGKIGFGDIPHFMELAGKSNELVAGFKDFEKSKEELQHLSKDELQALVAKIYDALEEVRVS